MSASLKERRETANAIRHCLNYLLQDAVGIGLTSSAAHIRRAIEELDQEMPRIRNPKPRLVHSRAGESPTTE